MSIAAVPDVTIDLRGLLNPDPILRLADAARSWVAGGTVRVLADDKCFVSDFLRWRGLRPGPHLPEVSGQRRFRAHAADTGSPPEAERKTHAEHSRIGTSIGGGLAVLGLGAGRLMLSER